MGKAKNKAPEESFSFVVDLRTVLALTPQQRVKWLSKACRKVADGDANIKHVYDVLSNKKLVAEMPDKVGRRMLRVLRENLYLFSEKQQRFLMEESAVAVNFSLDDRSEEEVEDPTGASQASGRGDDAAARMEEMMARCRDFVREKAGSFDQRRQEAEEAERQAALARQRQAEEKLAREWDAIHQWHRQLEGWEQASMVACDERYERHNRPPSRTTKRGSSRQSSGSSRAGASDSDRRHKRDREKDKDKDREKRRKRDRGRRRRRSSSGDSRGRDEDDLPEKRTRADEAARLPTATLSDLLRGSKG